MDNMFFILTNIWIAAYIVSSTPAALIMSIVCICAQLINAFFEYKQLMRVLDRE